MRKSVHGLFTVILHVCDILALESQLVVVLIHSTDWGGVWALVPHVQPRSAGPADGLPLISCVGLFQRTKVTESEKLIVMFYDPAQVMWYWWYCYFLSSSLRQLSECSTWGDPHFMPLTSHLSKLRLLSVSLNCWAHVPPLFPPSLVTIDFLCEWQTQDPARREEIFFEDESSASTPKCNTLLPSWSRNDKGKHGNLAVMFRWV